jgi:hypothetical protein
MATRKVDPKAAVPKAPIDLGELDGITVLSTGIEVPNAGGGLNKAMAIEPLIITHEDGKTYIALEVDLRKVRFEPITDDDDELIGYRRVHVMHATGAAIVDGETVKSGIDEMNKRIELAEEAKVGTQRLPMDLEAQHANGEHEFMPQPECTVCVAAGTVDAPAAEAAPKPKRQRGKAKAGTLENPFE